MIDLRSIVPAATELAERLVRENPGFFHAIMLDDWRGVRLIFDSDASRACDNHCDQCQHSRLFARNQDQGPELKATLFEFTASKDVSLYGSERFLPCKKTERYVQCFVNCILYDGDLRLRVHLREEIALVRGFHVVYNDRSLPNDELGRRMKQRIVSNALISLDDGDECRAEMLCSVLSELGWNFSVQAFR